MTIGFAIKLFKNAWVRHLGKILQDEWGRICCKNKAPGCQEL
jgi:hypothetical protein